MKKMIFLMVLAMSLLLTACSSGGNQDAPAASSETDVPVQDAAAAPAETEAPAQAEAYPEEETVKKVMDAIGTDLMERAKAKEFDMIIRFAYYRYDPPEGWETAEGQHFEDELIFNVTVESAMGSTMYDNFTVDCDILRELQYAILDSGVFNLTAEEVAQLKEHVYTEKVRSVDEISGERNHFRMNYVETPARYSVILTMSDGNDGRIHHMAHRIDQSRSYKWGELMEN